MAQVDDLERMIAEAECMVAFTGAGISTESGIPDYRSPGGIWTKFRPIDFGDFMASAEARRETWRRKFASHETLQKATPTPATARSPASSSRARWQPSSPRTSTACTRPPACPTTR